MLSSASSSSSSTHGGATTTRVEVKGRRGLGEELMGIYQDLGEVWIGSRIYSDTCSINLQFYHFTNVGST